jgi:hypothetical protein
MALVSSFSIVTLAILVAPGFVAVILAVNLGAVERDVSRFQLFMWSVVSSLIINVMALSLYQAIYTPIPGPDELQSLLFTPQFQFELVGLYIGSTLFVGLIYTAELIVEVRDRVQRLLWSRSEIRRHRRQPWEGALDDANVVRVRTASETRIIGRVREYSRISKPKQLWLDNVYWVDDDTDEPYDDGLTDSILLLEDDIQRVVILETVDAE